MIVIASALVLLVAMSASDEIGRAAAVAVIVAVQLVGLLATLRRLHDAGWSRWWLLLYLFPMSITLDLIQFTFGSATWTLVDLSAAIRLIPVVIGLLAPTMDTVDAGSAELFGSSRASAG